MTTRKPAENAPAKRRGTRESTMLGDPIAAAFAEVYGGVKKKPPSTEENAALKSTVDLGWLDRLHHLLAAWIREAKPADLPESMFLCGFVVELLKEHQEQGIKTRDLLLSARKIAGRMNVSNVYRYAFVGIVAEGATGDTPRRTRATAASKTSELIREGAARWVQGYMFEGGEQVAHKPEAIAHVRAKLAGILADKLVPKASVVEDWYDAWIAAQPESVPRPAHGNSKLDEKQDS